jgi:DNA-binding transcriptional LysR family regulator
VVLFSRMRVALPNVPPTLSLCQAQEMCIHGSTDDVSTRKGRYCGLDVSPHGDERSSRSWSGSSQPRRKRRVTRAMRKYGPLTFAQRTLRVQAPASVAARLLAPALPRFLHQRPGLRMQLSEIQGTQEPLLRDADAVLCVGEIDDPMRIVQQVATLRILTCASPDFIQCHGVPAKPADLAPRHCIGVVQRATTAVCEWTFGHGGKTWSIVPAAHMAFGSTDCAVTAAVHGGGYVRVSNIEVDEKITSGLLQPVLQEWDEEEPLSIVYSRDLPLSDDLAALIAFVAGLLPSTASEPRELSPTGSG